MKAALLFFTIILIGKGVYSQSDKDSIVRWVGEVNNVTYTLSTDSIEFIKLETAYNDTSVLSNPTIYIFSPINKNLTSRFKDKSLENVHAPRVVIKHDEYPTAIQLLSKIEFQNFLNNLRNFDQINVTVTYSKNRCDEKFGYDSCQNTVSIIFSYHQEKSTLFRTKH